MSYLDWNNKLAKHFFNEEMAGKEVLLYANRELIKTVGEGQGDVTNFIESIKIGPSWTTRSGICQKALQAYEGWRGRGLEYPPYIAFLVLFVLAEATEGDFAPQAYYPRLRNLLGDNSDSGMLPSFHRMWELWIDLEKWSKDDKNEELGRFTFRVRGGMDHVGLPLSQTILSHQEQISLPQIYNMGELDPTDLPSPGRLLSNLLEHGRASHLLERRTLQILESHDRKNIYLKDALIALVLDDLAAWDGSIFELRQNGAEARETKTGLRLCLDIDGLSGQVHTFLRLKSNRPYPENGLNFISRLDGLMLSCHGSVNNWSSCLEDATGHKYNAAAIDWKSGMSLMDEETNWSARLRNNDVRLFHPGKNDNLPNLWVETQHLERNCEFLVASYSTKSGKIHSWGQQNCDVWQSKNYFGLPAGWALFKGGNARNSCPDVDVLSLSDLVRLRLEGGIKTGRGNTYLSYGLPSIVLENVRGDEIVKINGIEIKRSDPAFTLWHLPVSLPLHTPIRIEVFRQDSEPLIARNIKIVPPQISSSFDDVPRRDSHGNIVDKNESVFTVGIVVSAAAAASCVSFPAVLPTDLSNRIIFVGLRPGEIREWPKETLPADWIPAWALAKLGRDQWRVHFCASSDSLEIYDKPRSPLPDAHAVKRWKEAIYVRRKRNISPSLRKLAIIWNTFVNATKYA